MRKDMNKVLTERPRRNGGVKYHHVRRAENAGNLEDLPHHCGMRSGYPGRRNFSDLLGPLRRFLHSCVGRRWDDVWSEICQRVPAGTVVNDHLREHAGWEVDTETFLEDGEVRTRSRYRSIRPGGLYVDPRDGILRDDAPRVREHVPMMRIDGRAYYKDECGILTAAWDKNLPQRKIIGHEQEAVKVDGIWYWCCFADVPAPRYYVKDDASGIRCQVTNITGLDPMKLIIVPVEKWDFVIRKHVDRGRYRAGKKQMASKDLAKYGLRND